MLPADRASVMTILPFHLGWRRSHQDWISLRFTRRVLIAPMLEEALPTIMKTARFSGSA